MGIGLKSAHTDNSERRAMRDNSARSELLEHLTG